MKILKSYELTVPVIIVGNITVGGNGKTPMVIWLANKLKKSGYRPGIISRGYGGKAKKWPQQVRPDSDSLIVGDEAIVISRRTGCPMAVGPDRVETGRALVKHSNCDIIISDDGMQHYRLKRDIEIAVVNSSTRFGNKLCLPAGPLREPIKRLNSVDYVISNGNSSHYEYCMEYQGSELYSLNDSNNKINLSEFAGKKIHAVAAIANPQRFFNNLTQQKLDVIEHVFLDHYFFKDNDLNFKDDLPIIMTEKDAVKCSRLKIKNCWYLPIDCNISNSLDLSILNKLEN